ncbi:hypothetical protein CEXT_33541 [Caerostris extrusa]|uniref:Uncharacterized protein n=1 Tax=Caerostris extrusa TaxID=172846 RepID=A0AAV4PSJ4_CAEEX|nr:hypothetical protein CEXT_33541 [Caerostris extrusa]
MVTFNVEWNVSYNDWGRNALHQSFFYFAYQRASNYSQNSGTNAAAIPRWYSESQTLHDRPPDTGMEKKQKQEQNNKRKPAYRGVWQKRKKGCPGICHFLPPFSSYPHLSLSLLKTSLLAYNETRKNCDLWTYVNPVEICNIERRKMRK